MCRRYSPKTNRFCVATTRTNHSPRGGNAHGTESQSALAFRQDAYESHPVGSRRLGPKRIFLLHVENVSAIAQRHFRLERQPSQQFRTELCSRPGLSNHKRPSRSHIHDSVLAQFFGQHARTKRPVPAKHSLHGEKPPAPSPDYKALAHPISAYPDLPQIPDRFHVPAVHLTKVAPVYSTFAHASPARPAPAARTFFRRRGLQPRIRSMQTGL